MAGMSMAKKMLDCPRLKAWTNRQNKGLEGGSERGRNTGVRFAANILSKSRRLLSELFSWGDCQGGGKEMQTIR